MNPHSDGIHPPHKQVPAKVTAYVDAGIKELVELLNAIPNICTIESCEGSDKHWAFVSLDYGVDYTNSDKVDLCALVSFANNLWDIIKDSELNGISVAGITDVVTISIEWHPRCHPSLIIMVEHHYIKQLVNILHLWHNEHILNKQQSMSQNLEVSHLEL